MLRPKAGGLAWLPVLPCTARSAPVACVMTAWARARSLLRACAYGCQLRRCCFGRACSLLGHAWPAPPQVLPNNLASLRARCAGGGSPSSVSRPTGVVVFRRGKLPMRVGMSSDDFTRVGGAGLGGWC